MSRAKPYSRRESRDSSASKRDLDSEWKHDLYTRTTLADRLQRTADSGSNNTRASRKSSARGETLLNRMSGGKGKELIPAELTSASSTSSSKLFGFDDGPTKRNPNARELLPAAGAEKAARAARGSRHRGVADAGQRNLVATSLGTALRPADRGSSATGYSSVAGGSGSPSLSIMGAAGVVCVRVENLVQGTCAEDVKSAFSVTTTIVDARLQTSRNDPSVTVDVDVPDRAAADELVAQYNGVVADGKTLRVTIMAGDGSGGGNGSSSSSRPQRQRDGANGRRGGDEHGSRLGSRLRHEAPLSGKMYADSLAREPPTSTVVVGDKSSLAARLGGRR